MPATGATKLDLAKQAAIAALDQFKDDDEVGLWVFTTEIDGRPNSETNYLELVPVQPIGRQPGCAGATHRRPRPAQRHAALRGRRGVVRDDARAYDPAKINAVVLLTDGVNDDGDPSDDDDQLEELITTLRGSSEGVNSAAGAHVHDRLRPGRRPRGAAPIAEATNAAAYDASNPATINQVFTAVVSNF